MIRSLAALGAAAFLAPALAYTPVDMLATPRPQAPVVHPDGVRALSAVDRWDPKTDKMARTVSLLQLNATTFTVLFTSPPSEASSFFWADGELAYLNGSTLFHASKPIFTFPSGIDPSNLAYDAVSHKLAFSGFVWADGNFTATGAHDAAYEERGTTGVVYDELFVRHWDSWITPGRAQTIGVVDLHTKEIANVLNGTGLYSQLDPIELAFHADTLAFSLKNPRYNVAANTREDVYLLSPRGKLTNLTPHVHGQTSSLAFSGDGKLAWLEMAEPGYEADRRVVVVHDGKRAERWTKRWDRSPASVSWAGNDSLLLLAEHHGRVLPYHLTHKGHLPTPLATNGSTSAIAVVEGGVLLSTSSIRGPAELYLLEHATNRHEDPDKTPGSLKQITHHADPLEVHVEEFWFEGVDTEVMGWAVWKGNKTEYPLAFMIHGGPQGAWEDAWSTRWNPAVFAEHGYFVVAINPTGSTGYGQEFCDRIQQSWGDRPYKDLLAGYNAALELYPQINPDRTAALGASYGGYMINWINGHNAFGFKTLVYHDGMLDTTDSYFSTEELWFPTREFGGTPMDARAEYEKFNPVNFVQEWATPQLVIQGGKDFRLPESQAIGTFTALQVQGVPSRFLYFPDENHWVLKPKNSRKWHHEVFRWLDEWVGDKAASAVGEREASAGLVVQ
ncbi:Dipeptidyl-peptidase 5 [Cryptotrichosporon argae]